MVSQTVLHIHEVPGYAQSHPKQPNDKALLVDWDGRPFALLYVTPEAYTLAWEGAVAFDRLEVEVADALNAFGLEGVSFRDPTWLNQTSVALVFQRSDNTDELVKYNLSISQEFNLYCQAVQNPVDVSFARYDFAESKKSAPFFSFIAENATLQQGSETEVALKLSRRYKWTETLLEWVITHHKQRKLLTQDLAQSSSVFALNQCLAIP